MDGKSEIGANELPKPDISISKELLVKTFNNPKFIANIVNLGHHAHLNYAEGNFVVQNKNGRPVVSDLIKSKRMGSVDDADDSLATNLNIYENVTFVDDLMLVTGGGEKPKLRESIFMLIHSHPVDKDYSVAKGLRPSATDLNNWQEHRGVLKNPYIINGISVNYGGEISLLLFQLDPNSREDLYWQQHSSSEPPEKLFEYMKQSGIRYSILKMKVKDKGFSEQELAKLEGFTVDNK